MFPRPPRIPREHGAWAMLAMPLLMGLIAAERVSVSSLLILPATLFLFLGRFAAVPRGTRVTRPSGGRVLWTAIYFTISATFLAGAVLLTDQTRRQDAILLAQITGALGLANAVLVLIGRGRNVGAEALAMASIAATGPLVMVLAGRPLRGETVGIGLLCLAYSLSALAFVRTHRLVREGPDKTGPIAGCVTVHVLLAGGLVAAAQSGWLAPALPWVFVAPVVRTATGLAWPARNLRILGFREIAVSVSFVVGAAILK